MRSRSWQENVKVALRPLLRLPLVRTLYSLSVVNPRQARVLARKELLQQFESLGANCELGFVQRHLETHPVSLFRWTGISLDGLCSALEEQLNGIGEQAELTVHVDEANDEYGVAVPKYHMHAHTGMYRHSCCPDELAAKFSVHLGWLKRKLLEDLGESQKIFVFQRKDLLDGHELSRLDEALRRYNPNLNLLCVHAASKTEDIGMVREVKPGLMVGYLDRVGLHDHGWCISYQVWLELLATTARLCGREVPRVATANVARLQLPLST